MSVRTITKGNEATDRESGRAAFHDAVIRNLEAVRDFPAFDSPRHQAAVRLVRSAATLSLGFVERETARSSNVYENHRTKIEGMGQATAIKYDLTGQRSFTARDAQNLDAELQAKFPGRRIDVGHAPNKPVCIIYVAL